MMEGDVGVVCPLQLSRVQSTGPSLCCSQVTQPPGAAVMCKVIRLTQNLSRVGPLTWVAGGPIRVSYTQLLQTVVAHVPLGEVRSPPPISVKNLLYSLSLGCSQACGVAV